MNVDGEESGIPGLGGVPGPGLVRVDDPFQQPGWLPGHNDPRRVRAGSDPDSPPQLSSSGMIACGGRSLCWHFYDRCDAAGPGKRTQQSRPEIVLVAGQDFSDRREQMWPDVHVEHPEAHQLGEDCAEVTEGNPWPIGYVWERLHYDWSEPNVLRGRVVDSNLFKPGSSRELWATPERAAAALKSGPCSTCGGTAAMLAPFFLTFIPGSAAPTVREHLRHVLASIEGTNIAAGEVI